MACTYEPLCLLFAAIFCNALVASTSAEPYQTYIVRLDGQPFPVAAKLNTSLTKSFSSRNAFITASARRDDAILAHVNARPASKIYEYHYAMRGFAARLSPSQAEALTNMAGVESVTLDTKRKICTTYSPTYLGLNASRTSNPPGVYRKYNGTGMIVGMIDSGVWPENLSFKDRGYPKPPKKFKGICQRGERWNANHCNRKIIGARYFLAGYENGLGPIDGQDYRSARDIGGHGSHTASTAAGSQVANAKLGHVDMGQTHGIAFGAHISVYKVCWIDGSCFDSDILSGIEHAIADNVDVLSISLGGLLSKDPLSDSIFTGTLLAAIAGIPSACSAGNDGNSEGALNSVAPWHVTVASSYLPRSSVSPQLFEDDIGNQAKKYIYLGNSSRFSGYGLSDGTLPHGRTNPKLPLIYAKNAALKGANRDNARFCLTGVLNKTIVRGKIIVCDVSEYSDARGQGAKAAGAKGVVLRPESDFPYFADQYDTLPTIIVSYTAGLAIMKYITNTRRPTAAITPLIIKFGQKPAYTSDFSSRGPNHERNIVKPNVIAPGEDIFASSSPYDLNFNGNLRKAQFSFMKGTSMAAPHVAGALLLLKQANPKWTVGMLTSALSTTAMPLSTGDATDFGSGLIRPNYASNPGFVYPSDDLDYRIYLCTYYKTAKVKKLIGKDCPKGSIKDYNYNTPSVMMRVPVGKQYKTTRRVQNVGPKAVTYKLSIKQPSRAHVTIVPNKLVFKRKDQLLKFTISIKGNKSTASDFPSSAGYTAGSWSWISTDKKYTVRSPIVVVAT